MKTMILFAILLLAFLLRFPFLGSLPALYTDEASLGYNAWSILETGRDEYGTLLPVSLRSFGDWKPPLSSYLMLPFIGFLGLNEWSVRLPSLVFGLGTIFLIYFLLSRGFNQPTWGLWAAFFLTMTPWHIHQSRMAMLVGPTLFFFTLGVVGWVMQHQGKFWRWASVFGFVAAVYGYYGARVVVPLMVFFLFISQRKRFSREFFRAWVIPVLFGLFLLAPLGVAFLDNQEVIFGRARHVSVFADRGIELKIWDDTTSDGTLTEPLIARFWHNKPFAYTGDILRRYGEHLDGRFLFFQGTATEPFELPGLGEFLWIVIPFMLFGIAVFFRDRPRGFGVLLAWAGISLIPAALTFMTPASNRSFFIVVPLAVASGYGAMVFFRRRLRWRPFIVGGVVVLFVVNIGYFVSQYYIQLPKVLGAKYRYGAKEVVDYVVTHAGAYDTVVLSPGASHYIYFLFYTTEDPRTYRSTARIDETLDPFGFEHVNGYEKYTFRRSFRWKDEPKKQGILFVAADHEVPGDVPIGYNVRHTVYYPNGKPAYRIFDL